MVTTIIYSVNGREIGRDIYSSPLQRQEVEAASREMTDILPNLQIIIERTDGIDD